MKTTILLIEDNERNRYLTTFLLEKHGYQVFIAEDGAAGSTWYTRSIQRLSCWIFNCQKWTDMPSP